MLCAAAHNTYIATWAGWLYLATVIDCFTKACIGYAMADHMRTSLVIEALDMAAASYDISGAIFHSDRGTTIHVRRIRKDRQGFRAASLRGTNRGLLRQRPSRNVQLRRQGGTCQPGPNIPPGNTPAKM